MTDLSKIPDDELVGFMVRSTGAPAWTDEMQDELRRRLSARDARITELEEKLATCKRFHTATEADRRLAEKERDEAHESCRLMEDRVNRLVDQSARVVELENALREAIQVIVWCGLNDRTRKYGYGEARPNGDLPGRGAVFNTPREFAQFWTEKLGAALAVRAEETT